MLLEALHKLHEALAIIDLHEAHLSGIHVASAIEALSAQLQQGDCESDTDQVASGHSSH